jgi:hypothetical protein
MKAMIMSLNATLGWARATTSNNIGVAFKLPAEGTISLSDEIDLDLETLDTEQTALNLTTGKPVRLRIAAQDVVDLTLPEGRWPTRFPTVERRRSS